MATADNLDGFILKKEACAAYQRSFRQLGRDLDKAFTKRDADFLDHFRLRIEDGTVLAATEVDKEQIQRLRDKGLNPTWFVREQWMRDKYGLRAKVNEEKTDGTSQEFSSSNQKVSVETSASTPTTENLIQSKDDLVAFLREENEFLRDTLSKERERGHDDRQLTRELHVLLKNMQDRLLPSPDAGRVHVAVQAPSEPAVTANAPTRPPNKRNTTRKKASKQPTGKSSSRVNKEIQKKPKWYEMPTLKRFLSS